MSDEQGTHTAGFAERVRANQQRLTAELKPHYDFIVCGSGSSGSVVARRLAENLQVSVLLLEAGGSDDRPSIMEASQWPLNLGSERDWAFLGQPNPHLNGRSIPLNMGKVVGGGSSINVMAWARTPKRLGFLRRRGARPGMELWGGAKYLSSHRRLARRPRPKVSRNRGTGFRSACSRPQPDRSRYGGRSLAQLGFRLSRVTTVA